MTDSQRRFAEEYVRSMDKQAAYKAAYPYVKKDMSAAAGASRLLNDAKYRDVQEYIDKLKKKAADEAVADAHEVLASLTAILRGETEDQVVVTEGQGEGFSQARIIEKRVSEKDRLKAAELLAKYHQLLVPKVQIEAEKGGGVIVLAEATEGEP